MHARDIARFEAKVDRSGGPDACHPWTAYRLKGYGRFGMGKRKVHYANRVAFLIEHGRWPEPCALHSCDNPPRCNPRHIYEGDNNRNIADRVARGRSYHGRAANPQRGADRWNTNLTDEMVRGMLTLKGSMLQREIARRFGVTEVTVSEIFTGKSWRHLTAAPEFS